MVPDHLRYAYCHPYAYVHPHARRCDWNLQRITDENTATDVPCYAGSAATIHRENAFRDAGLGTAKPLPVARELGETSLCLLCHPTLTDEHVGRAVQVASEVVGRATR